MGEGEDKYLVYFDSGKTKTFRRNTKWWVEPPQDERETEMVSHRRRPGSYTQELNVVADLPVAHYAENFQRHADAAEKAVKDARLASATNPEGAVLFLHEATVQAALAQGHATMANAMATKGASIELRAVD